MDRESQEVAAAPEAGSPEAALAEIRAHLREGRPLVGSLATAFYRAMAAVDPAAVEDSLAVLPGNGNVHVYESMLAWASLVPGEQILDVGCGSGGATRVAAALVGPRGLVVGIDPVSQTLAVARRRTPAGLPIVYRPGQVERLSGIEDRRFDVVVASMVLEQVNDLAVALAEISRVLRPGGRLVASVMAFDRLRPFDSGLMGAVLAVVGRHAPGALVGRASRASIPGEPEDAEAFRLAGLNTPEERDAQLAVVMADAEEALTVFGRSAIWHMLDDEGRAALRRVLERRTPHTLYLPVRFLRTRRPG